MKHVLFGSVLISSYYFTASAVAHSRRGFLASTSTLETSAASVGLADVHTPSPTLDTSAAEHRKAGITHNVVYTADAIVFSALLRSMQSLTLHLGSPELCSIHLIVPPADVQQALNLVTCFQQLVQHGNGTVPHVEVYQAHPMHFKVDYRGRPDLQGHASAYTRFLIPEYLPNVSRVVYLDTDTLVRGDLTPLFDMQLNHSLAAVQEGTTFKQLWGKWLTNLAELVPDPEQAIFNDGVMVLDLDRWRAENITSDLEAWVMTTGASVDDQLALNLEFQTKRGFDTLPHEWNDFRVRPTGWPDFGWSDDLRPEDEFSHAQIIHWTGPKPWNLKDKQLWLQTYRQLWDIPGSDAKVACSSSDKFRM